MALDDAFVAAPAETPTPRRSLFALVIAGAVLGTVLLVGFTEPLSIWKHSEIIGGDQPLAVVLGTGRTGALHFLVVVVCVFAAFAGAALLARRVAGRCAFWIVIGGTALFAAALVPMNPVGAQDVYHNVADARTLWLHGENPMSTPPAAHPDDAFSPQVPVWADHASSYGPLWYVIAGAPLPFAGADLWPNVIGQKLIAAAFLLIVTILVMLIAERIHSTSGIAAGVLVGWNPLLLFETAGNAHNDIVMAAFALGAFYAIVRKWWIAVFPVLALAVAVKYTLIVLAPLVLIWMIASTQIPLRTVARSLLAGVVIGLLCFAPLLRDGTLAGALARQGDYFDSSPGSLLIAYLLGHSTMSVAEAAHAMKIVMSGIFLIGYGTLIWRTPRNPSFALLADTSDHVILLFLFTASWWFWPWYLIWLVPFASLRPRRAAALTGAVFAMTAMLMYIPHFWQLYTDWGHLQRLVVATTFTAPLALTLVDIVRSWLVPRLRRVDRVTSGRAPSGTQAP